MQSKPYKMGNNSVIGKIVEISEPKIFVDKRNKTDYFHLRMVDSQQRIIKIYVSTASLGLYSEKQSKIFFYNKKTGRLTPHQMVTPKRLLNQRVEVRGSISLTSEGYYINRVEMIKLL